MTSNDIDYYRQRAAEERAAAKAAADNGIAMIHEELAKQYEALVRGRGTDNPTGHHLRIPLASAVPQLGEADAGAVT